MASLDETDTRAFPSVSAEASPIDPADLEVALRVLGEAQRLPGGHPDAIALQRAASNLYKRIKKQRRVDRRNAILAHDEAITHATATGAPGRIDDETRGIPLQSSVRGAIAGYRIESMACYVCKEHFHQVDAFYHQLCPSCAEKHHAKRDQRTDLTGRRALLTGGRAKIGMYIALRLLRDGAHTTITTRFPNDAVRRFQAMPDSADWIHRLRIVGIDLRDPAQVVALADSVAEAGPLDILINNAAQTVRRSAEAYAPLVEAEAAAAASALDGPLPEIVVLGRGAASAAAAMTGEDAAAAALAGASAGAAVGTDPAATAAVPAVGDHWSPTPHALTAMALTARSASPERVTAGDAIDAGGLLPDLVSTNSWIQVVEEVDPLELLEVQLCNMTAPFILVSRLRPAMRASSARRRYVVNVSAMEGQFSRGYKGPGHPHTNMAKAALNMLTRTSAGEMLERDGILMTAVDTGWITDERPHTTKIRLADAGFHAPLDLVDGAARVYDPIVRGEAGEDLHGVFLKDYKPSAW